MLLFLLALVRLAQAADYACTTEFGETLPLSQSVLRGDSPCHACEAPGTPIPNPRLEARWSAAWNETARGLPGPTKVRRRLHARGGKRALLDTRYLTQRGPSFGMKISCPRSGKCQGAFANGSETLLLSTPLLDERSPGHGLAELKLGSREHLGLIVRVKKTNLKEGRPDEGSVSASGELKIYREDPLFIQDVGVDQNLTIMPELKARLAAFELKIRCRRED